MVTRYISSLSVIKYGIPKNKPAKSYGQAKDTPDWIIGQGSPVTDYCDKSHLKSNNTGGWLFALWLVAGNMINSFMEEGLFRGVMLNLNRLRFSFWKAIWLQAALFGAWHLVWVFKWIQTGAVSTPGEIGMAVISNFLPQICLGLVWGYAYLKTDNLWTAWLGHTLNTTLNLLHVATLDSMDPGMSIRMTTFSIVSLLMMFVIRWICIQRNMPEVQPDHLLVDELPDAAARPVAGFGLK